LPDGPLIVARDGLIVVVRLLPRAKADRLSGVASAEGGRVLKASVTASAESGRRDVSIAAGASCRSKVVRPACDPQRVIARISPEISRLRG
jgi:uncharacterized protein YggU (UPF0235/DUF167 family)